MNPRIMIVSSVPSALSGYQECVEKIKAELESAGFNNLLIVNQSNSIADKILSGNLRDEVDIIIFVSWAWFLGAALIKQSFPDVQVIIVSVSKRNDMATEERVILVDKEGDYPREVLCYIREEGR